MSDNKFITRKEISSLINCNVQTVWRNEKKWGLDKFRDAFSCPVRYRKVDVLKLFKELQFI